MASGIAVMLLAMCTSRACSAAKPHPTAMPVPPPYRQSAAIPVPCAHRLNLGRARPLPDGFPALFPLPAHMLIASVQHQAGFLTFEAAVPASFARTAQFLQQQPARYGWHIIAHDAEPPREADGTLVGHGFFLHWKLLNTVRCGSASFLIVSSRRTRSG